MTTPATEEQTPAPRVGLSTTADGVEVPSAAERSRWRMDGRLMGWLAPIGVMLVAFGLRLYHLGQPHKFSFDETYYAKDAWSMLNFGYVKTYQEKIGGQEINDVLLDGRTHGVWTDDPSMIVHPEVGKWLIALGEKAFGMDPFGWRISAVVVGSLMVLVLARLVRRMTGSTLLGCVAGALLALDGMHFVLSRLALLDIFLAFFMLCGVTCVVNDRFWFRARLARRIAAEPDGAVLDRSGWGPVRGLLFRPWLLLGGVCFGLAIGTKWTAAPALAVFGLLVWLWSAGARKAHGVRFAVLRSAVADGLGAFAQLVLVAFVVYVTSWTGWMVHADQYEQKLSATQYTQFAGEQGCDGESSKNKRNDDVWPTKDEPDASGLGEVTQSLRSLFYYHQDLYNFHAHFLNCAEHTYASKPLGWMLLNRPVGAAADTGIEPGTRGCEAKTGSTCLRQVLILGTPMIWWAGIGALLYAAARWLGGRDWRFGVAVVGALCTWLPWFQYDDRPIFSFYAITILPFIVLALTLTIGRLLGGPETPPTRRTVGVIVAGAFVILTLINFAWFWPIYTNGLLTHGEWTDRIWFSRWI